MSDEELLEIIGDIYEGLVLGIQANELERGYEFFAPACLRLVSYLKNETERSEDDV